MSRENPVVARVASSLKCIDRCFDVLVGLARFCLIVFEVGDANPAVKALGRLLNLELSSDLLVSVLSVVLVSDPDYGAVSALDGGGRKNDCVSCNDSHK